MRLGRDAGALACCAPAHSGSVDGAATSTAAKPRFACTSVPKAASPAHDNFGLKAPRCAHPNLCRRHEATAVDRRLQAARPTAIIWDVLPHSENVA